MLIFYITILKGYLLLLVELINIIIILVKAKEQEHHFQYDLY